MHLAWTLDVEQQEVPESEIGTDYLHSLVVTSSRI